MRETISKADSPRDSDRSASGSGRRKELIPVGNVQNSFEQAVEAIEVGHRLDLVADPFIGRIGTSVLVICAQASGTALEYHS